MWQAILGLTTAVAIIWAATQKHWKGAAQALEQELRIVRERCYRLDGENKENAKIIAELHAKTDLTRIERQLTDNQSENHTTFLKIIEELKSISVSSSERNALAVNVMNACVQSINELSRHVAEQFGVNGVALAGVAATLTAIEGRLGLALALPLSSSAGPSHHSAPRG